MVQIVVFSKSDILEKLAWCKKYASTSDEDERLQKAKLELEINVPITAACSDPSLDSYKIGPKLKELGFTFPTADDLDLFSSKLFKEVKLYALFDQIEMIPGKPEFEIGFGFKVETYNVFLEEAVHAHIEKIVKQKTGMMSTKEVKVKEKRLKTMEEVFGEAFKGSNYNLAATGREKDKRGNLRYGIRAQSNLIVAGSSFAPEKLDQKWKDESQFFELLCAKSREIEAIINKIFVIVGYEKAPDYSILFGDVTTDRNISKFVKQTVGKETIVDAQYI